MNQRTKTAVVFAAFVGTVVLANWLLSTFGVLPILGGVPAGVLAAGAAFTIRDTLHDLAGRRVVIAAIAAGSVLSYVLSDGSTIPGGVTSIAVASAAAFTFSELLDAAIYDRIRHRQWAMAVIASGIAGAILDSALFLYLAFGSVDYIAGQVIAKAVVVAAFMPLAWLVRR